MRRSWTHSPQAPAEGVKKIYWAMRVTNDEVREKLGLAPSVSRIGDEGGAEF